MDYIAHIRESDKEEQTLRQHLLESKEFCEKEGEKLGLRKVAGLAGLLHDLGKATPEFFNYLNDAVYHPEKKLNEEVLITRQRVEDYFLQGIIKTRKSILRSY
ncbi:HD domain-containing protein [Enterococcus alcedinis]|uniref:HD domain-containing protein n=1 Tax=Enterococcus alcedinis TaxID=1274384 RepID=UPI003622879B